MHVCVAMNLLEVATGKIVTIEANAQSTAREWRLRVVGPLVGVRQGQVCDHGQG
jgi:hypothetical protein